MRGPQRFRRDLDRGDAVLDFRVAEEVGRDVVGVMLLLLEDALEEARAARGVVPRANHEDAAELVRFGLVLAAVAELHRHVGGLGRDQEAGLLGRDGGRHPRDSHEQIGDLRLLAHAGVVVLLDVGDLVPHDPRQLVDARYRENGAAVEVDVPAGNGEGVECGVVDDAEAVDEGLGFDLAHEGLAELVDEVRHHRIVDHRDDLLQLAVELHADLALVVVADGGNDRPEGVEARAVVLDARGEAGRRGCGERQAARRAPRAHTDPREVGVGELPSAHHRPIIGDRDAAAHGVSSATRCARRRAGGRRWRRAGSRVPRGSRP